MFEAVVCGGTFDHFHKGHKAFLRFAFAHGKKVFIGITSDTFAGGKDSGIEPFTLRKRHVEQFLDKKEFSGRFELMPIHSPHIPDQWNTNAIEAIITTPITKRGVRVINADRKAKRLKPLKVLSCDLVIADDQKPLSSSRIRSGEVDREGSLYIRKEWMQKTLLLPDSLRSTLQKPFGVLVPSENISLSSYKKKRIITVGDVVTAFFLKHHIIPHISVVDFYVQRKKKFTMLSQLGFKGHERVRTITNPAGKITPKAFILCQNLFRKKDEKTPVIIRVIGEEDLIVLPLLLASPLGHVLVYGQPNEGVVEVPVTEENKKRAYNITTRFLTRKD